MMGYLRWTNRILWWDTYEGQDTASLRQLATEENESYTLYDSRQPAVHHDDEDDDDDDNYDVADNDADHDADDISLAVVW